MNKELFDFVKIKPLLKQLGMSHSRFTQKLYQYKVKGFSQNFTDEERLKIKQNLLVIAAIIKEEAEKIN